MATSRVARIYKRHVKPLPAAERLQLLAMVAYDLAEEPHPVVGGPRRSVMARGLARRSEGGVDAQGYVNKLRDEWDRQAS